MRERELLLPNTIDRRQSELLEAIADERAGAPAAVGTGQAAAKLRAGKPLQVRHQSFGVGTCCRRARWTWRNGRGRHALAFEIRESEKARNREDQDDAN
jgi:hypothetical protein